MRNQHGKVARTAGLALFVVLISVPRAMAQPNSGGAVQPPQQGPAEAPASVSDAGDTQPPDTSVNLPGATNDTTSAQSAPATRPRRTPAISGLQSRARSMRAPEMIGDFLGFTIGTTLAQSTLIPPKPFELSGQGLQNLPVLFDAAQGMTLGIPAGSLIGNGLNPLAETVTLRLTESQPGSGNFDTLDPTSLDGTESAALGSWLGNGAGSLLQPADPIAGNINPQQAGFSATPDGAAAEADLKVTTTGFNVGGFAPGQQLHLFRPGSQISRYKAGEQNSAVPRDRIFFNDSFFGSVPGTGGAQDVNRFVPGFEKTLGNGESSLELRLPFASTFDSNQSFGINGQASGGSGAELGNLTVAYKHVLTQSETLMTTAGVGLELPTADDLVIQSSAVRIARKGESIHINPYVAALYTPDDRWFTQTFLQMSFAANGEQTTIQDLQFDSSSTGILQDATVLFADTAAGYWFFRKELTTRPTELSGIAGILEIHFAQTVQDTDVLSAHVGGRDYVFGTSGGSIGLANLTTGAVFQFGTQSTLTLAWTTALTHTDRQFDNEFQVLFSYYFDGLGSTFSNPGSGPR